MDHGPSSHWGEDLSSGYKTRLGIWFFLVYGVIYAGFVVINSVRPDWMALSVGRLNLAILYGMGLIVVALIMALVYNILASHAEERYNIIFEPETEEEDAS